MQSECPDALIQCHLQVAVATSFSVAQPQPVANGFTQPVRVKRRDGGRSALGSHPHQHRLPIQTEPSMRRIKDASLPGQRRIDGLALASLIEQVQEAVGSITNHRDRVTVRSGRP